MKTKLLGTLGVLGAFFMTTSMTAKTTNTDSKPANETTITFTAGTDRTSESSITKDNVKLVDQAGESAFSKNPYVFKSTEFGDSLYIQNDHDSITNISIYSSDDSAASFDVSSFASSTYSFNETTHIGTIDFSGEEGGGTSGCLFLNTSGLNINVENIYVTIKKTETPSFAVTNSIGGYYVKGSNKVQFASFGFQISSTDDVTEYAIDVYKDSEKTDLLCHRTSDDIDSLKAKDGRFYTTIDANTEGFEKNHTYYAIAYVAVPGGIIESNLIPALSDNSIATKPEKF